MGFLRASWLFGGGMREGSEQGRPGDGKVAILQGPGPCCPLPPGSSQPLHGRGG